MKPAPHAHCRHCGNPLWPQGDRRGGNPANRLTRDHIVPKRRRGPPIPQVRAIWPSCEACNSLRATLWHCPAMLHFAADLARAIGITRKEAIRAFRLDGRRGFYTPPPTRTAA